MERFPHEVTISKLSGSHFEIGTELGKKAIQKYGPGYIDKSLKAIEGESLYKALGLRSDLPPRFIDAVFPVAESIIGGVHPELLDEIKGFAESLGEDYRRTLTFLCNYDPHGCSQFFVNGFLARNYDDAPTSVENEFLLISPEGSLKSFGASTNYVGRLDGINEAGLAVSLTFGAGFRPTSHGIGAPMFLRILLDKAETVDQTLELFKKTSYVAPNNVMVADASGASVVIEQSAGQHAIRRSESGIFACANHYRDPEMREKQQRLINPTTFWREKQMESKGVKLDTSEAIMDFLTLDFPEGGLFEPYYSFGLGTLWSVVYEPKTGAIHLAIGEKGVSRKDVKLNLTELLSSKNLPISLKTHLTDVLLKPRLPQYKV